MAAAVFRGPFRALASPRFTVYWVAQGISVVADRAYLVAYALQLGVVEGRSDLLAVALAANGIAFALPMVLLGAVVDRIGPRAGIMLGDAIRFAATLVLAAAVTGGDVPAWLWVAVAALVGLGEAFFYPSFGAATPLLVPPDRLASANGLRLGAQYVGSTLGPVLVGVLLAADRLDVVFWAQALTFLIAAAAAVAIPRRRPPERRRQRRSTLHDAAAGVRFVAGQAYLLVAVAVLFVNVLLLDPSRFVFLPLHASDPDGLGLGTAGFAWLAAAGGAGAIAGSLYWGRRERGPGERVGAFVGSTLLLGVGWAMAGLPWTPLAFIGMAVAGFGIPGANVVLYAALQARVPSAFLGRTFAVVETATYVGGPLGFVIAPLLVGQVAPGLMVVLAGVGIAASGLVAAVWLRGLDDA
jgi:DHA3 family macrolide efflux protein-like MFS transporter